MKMNSEINIAHYLNKALDSVNWENFLTSWKLQKGPYPDSDTDVFSDQEN